MSADVRETFINDYFALKFQKTIDCSNYVDDIVIHRSNKRLNKNPKQVLALFREACGYTFRDEESMDHFVSYLTTYLPDIHTDNGNDEKKTWRVVSFLLCRNIMLLLATRKSTEADGSLCTSFPSSVVGAVSSLRAELQRVERLLVCSNTSLAASGMLQQQMTLTMRYLTITVSEQIKCLGCTTGTTDTVPAGTAPVLAEFGEVSATVVRSIMELVWPVLKVKKAGIFSSLTAKKNEDTEVYEAALAHWICVFSAFRRVLVAGDSPLALASNTCTGLVSPEVLSRVFQALSTFVYGDPGPNVPSGPTTAAMHLTLARHAAALLQLIASNLDVMSHITGSPSEHFLTTFTTKLPTPDIFTQDMMVVTSLLQVFRGLAHSEFKLHREHQHQHQQQGNAVKVFTASAALVSAVTTYVLPLIASLNKVSTKTVNSDGSASVSAAINRSYALKVLSECVKLFTVGDIEVVTALKLGITVATQGQNQKHVLLILTETTMMLGKGLALGDVAVLDTKLVSQQVYWQCLLRNIKQLSQCFVALSQTQYLNNRCPDRVGGNSTADGGADAPGAGISEEEEEVECDLFGVPIPKAKPPAAATQEFASPDHVGSDGPVTYVSTEDKAVMQKLFGFIGQVFGKLVRKRQRTPPSHCVFAHLLVGVSTNLLWLNPWFYSYQLSDLKVSNRDLSTTPMAVGVLKGLRYMHQRLQHVWQLDCGSQSDESLMKMLLAEIRSRLSNVLDDLRFLALHEPPIQPSSSSAIIPKRDIFDMSTPTETEVVDVPAATTGKTPETLSLFVFVVQRLLLMVEGMHDRFITRADGARNTACVTHIATCLCAIWTDVLRIETRCRLAGTGADTDVSAANDTRAACRRADINALRTLLLKSLLRAVDHTRLGVIIGGTHPAPSRAVLGVQSTVPEVLSMLKQNAIKLLVENALWFRHDVTDVDTDTPLPPVLGKAAGGAGANVSKQLAALIQWAGRTVKITPLTVAGAEVTECEYDLYTGIAPILTAAAIREPVGAIITLAAQLLPANGVCAVGRLPATCTGALSALGVKLAARIRDIEARGSGNTNTSDLSPPLPPETTVVSAAPVDDLSALMHGLSAPVPAITPVAAPSVATTQDPSESFYDYYRWILRHLRDIRCPGNALFGIVPNKNSGENYHFPLLIPTTSVALHVRIQAALLPAATNTLQVPDYRQTHLNAGTKKDAKSGDSGKGKTPTAEAATTEAGGLPAFSAFDDDFFGGGASSVIPAGAGASMNFGGIDDIFGTPAAAPAAVAVHEEGVSPFGPPTEHFDAPPALSNPATTTATITAPDTNFDDMFGSPGPTSQPAAVTSSPSVSGSPAVATAVAAPPMKATAPSTKAPKGFPPPLGGAKLTAPTGGAISGAAARRLKKDGVAPATVSVPLVVPVAPSAAPIAGITTSVTAPVAAVPPASESDFSMFGAPAPVPAPVPVPAGNPFASHAQNAAHTSPTQPPASTPSSDIDLGIFDSSPTKVATPAAAAITPQFAAPTPAGTATLSASATPPLHRAATMTPPAGATAISGAAARRLKKEGGSHSSTFSLQKPVATAAPVARPGTVPKAPNPFASNAPTSSPASSPASAPASSPASAPAPASASAPVTTPASTFTASPPVATQSDPFGGTGGFDSFSSPSAAAPTDLFGGAQQQGQQQASLSVGGLSFGSAAPASAPVTVSSTDFDIFGSMSNSSAPASTATATGGGLPKAPSGGGTVKPLVAPLAGPKGAMVAPPGNVGLSAAAARRQKAAASSSNVPAAGKSAHKKAYDNKSSKSTDQDLLDLFS